MILQLISYIMYLHTFGYIEAILNYIEIKNLNWKDTSSEANDIDLTIPRHLMFWK